MVKGISSGFKISQINLLKLHLLLLALIPISQVELVEKKYVYFPLIGIYLIVLAAQLLLVNWRKSLGPSLWVLVFISYILVSMMLGTQQYLSNDIVIAAIPFFSIVLLPIFISGAYQLWLKDKFFMIILIPTAAYTIKFYYALILSSIKFGHISRLTLLAFDSVLSLNVLGLILLNIYVLMLNKKRKWLILMTITFIPIIYTYTRSIIICLVLVGIYFMVRYTKLWTAKLLILLPLAIFLIPVYQLTSNETSSVGKVVNIYVQRFSTIASPEDQGTRFNEITLGFQRFIESPILGKNLGYKLAVPTDDGSVRITRYIHNGTIYILMNLGIVGYLFYYVIPIFIWLKIVTMKLPSDKQSRIWKLYLEGSLLYLILFSQFFAAVRLVHFNAFLLFHLSAIIVWIRMNRVRIMA